MAVGLQGDERWVLRLGGDSKRRQLSRVCVVVVRVDALAFARSVSAHVGAILARGGIALGQPDGSRDENHQYQDDQTDFGTILTHRLSTLLATISSPTNVANNAAHPRIDLFVRLAIFLRKQLATSLRNEPGPARTELSNSRCI